MNEFVWRWFSRFALRRLRRALESQIGPQYDEGLSLRLDRLAIAEEAMKARQD